MQLRFPWILSRRRLLVAVTLDSVMFLALYHGLYWHRFGLWPDRPIFLTILWSIWLLSSYVLGRYQGVDGLRTTSGSLFVLQGVVKITLVVAFSLAGTLTYFWLFRSDAGYSLFRSFLVPYLVFLSIVSDVIQTFLGAWVRKRQIDSHKWCFVGSLKSYERLRYHLQWSRLPVSLNHCKYDHLDALTGSLIVVDDFLEQPSWTIKRLLTLQQAGSTIVSRQYWCEVVLQRFPSEYLRESDLLQGEFSFPLGTFQFRLKRLGDVILSVLLLVLASPLLLLSGLLIKLEDSGPILYSQIRSGFDGSHYTIYKLRTMRVDAELNGAQWVQRTDSRVTNIGSLLRRTRIDELPQLWCVFVGSMSLIGPRPERPEFDRELEAQIPHYRLRQRMRPGLSGWAQVNYPYGASVEDAANKLSYDLYYLRNFSFFLDLLIMFKTIRLVFNAQGSLPVTPPSSVNI